jgi:hypothetical protein
MIFKYVAFKRKMGAQKVARTVIYGAIDTCCRIATARQKTEKSA